jgi:hypothetical protein
MANLFDSTNAPEGEPSQLVVGDFIQWKVTDLVNDYPSDSYTLTYIARIIGAKNEISITASDQTTHYLVSISSTTSAAYIPGNYSWQKEIIRNSDSARIIVSRGTWKVLPDLDISGADPRSHAEIMVSKIESILSGKADSDVSSYSISGRSLTKMSFTELMEARNYYLSEIKQMKVTEDIINGRSGKQTILARF